jgi:hypothetical protein
MRKTTKHIPLPNTKPNQLSLPPSVPTLSESKAVLGEFSNSAVSTILPGSDSRLAGKINPELPQDTRTQPSKTTNPEIIGQPAASETDPWNSAVSSLISALSLSPENINGDIAPVGSANCLHPELRKALNARGFTDAQIAANYSIIRSWAYDNRSFPWIHEMTGPDELEPPFDAGPHFPISEAAPKPALQTLLNEESLAVVGLSPSPEEKELSWVLPLVDTDSKSRVFDHEPQSQSATTDTSSRNNKNAEGSDDTIRKADSLPPKRSTSHPQTAQSIPTITVQPDRWIPASKNFTEEERLGLVKGDPGSKSIQFDSDDESNSLDSASRPIPHWVPRASSSKKSDIPKLPASSENLVNFPVENKRSLGEFDIHCLIRRI